MYVVEMYVNRTKKCICELMRGHHKTNENFFIIIFLNV